MGASTRTRYYGSFVLAAAVAAVALAAWSARADTATQLRITTFNVEWYGLHGDVTPTPPPAPVPSPVPPTFLGQPAPTDERDTALNKFIHEDLGHSDAIMFEEIVDVAKLQREVIGNSMSCTSYEHPYASHQHVVLCFRQGLRFDHEIDDNNYAVESVSDVIGGRVRPALAGVLRNESGTAITHILGVHLKAYPDQTDKRVLQAGALSDRIAQFKDGLPVIVLGDFNSFPKSMNGHPDDDVALIGAEFQRHSLGLRIVENPIPYTFRSGNMAQKLDHVWVGERVQVLEQATVPWPCDESGDRGSFRDLPDYNRRISDHCPVTTTLGF